MVVVVSGGDGAVPSVIAGLVSAPIIAVPTSVGYGASLGGISSLLASLATSSPGAHLHASSQLPGYSKARRECGGQTRAATVRLLLLLTGAARANMLRCICDPLSSLSKLLASQCPTSAETKSGKCTS